ncbi:AraC family transcriptional regulator [Vibrio sp. Sgm 22]|uniref:AraC family transcriptional regulator n=1 Tax=unclassified Vibrio TaxID=2614977 RepID=UPI00224887B2|nr:MULTISPECIES: AraC family transcriptional regulator [unclassified Vibrio]MCX2760636.1 AraC family transcriptional regulator [Vibrio sp. 14G-20]MCX2777656.1 AraC family transcriptional regulator [Vibrio sp. Sgm 22]
MNTLAQLMQSYVEYKGWDDLEGIRETEIEGVWFYRSSGGNQRQPFTYQSGIIMLGQGKKNIYIGERPVTYAAGDYLVVGVPMPLECEALPVDGEPLLGLSINIDSQRLHSLVKKLEDQGFLESYCNKHKQNSSGLESTPMEGRMLESFTRLIKTLHCDIEANILGDALVSEIVYRALTGSEGRVLFDLAHHDGHYARVAKALSKVHEEYDQTITVQSLADEANMSVSAFHNAFRNVTFESPLQYLKKVRLNKAKELIQLEGLRINDAARRVGYSSPSQFSREFKRHFNTTPRAV